MSNHTSVLDGVEAGEDAFVVGAVGLASSHAARERNDDGSSCFILGLSVWCFDVRET